MRSAACVIMIGSFLVLGVIDLCGGDIRRGVASLLLATVQVLIFW